MNFIIFLLVLSIGCIGYGLYVHYKDKKIKEFVERNLTGRVSKSKINEVQKVLNKRFYNFKWSKIPFITMLITVVIGYVVFQNIQKTIQNIPQPTSNAMNASLSNFVGASSVMNWVGIVMVVGVVFTVLGIFNRC